MTEPTGLPAGVLVAFYGDDFTGSSAVMEVMTFAGLPAVMFVETPTSEQLERFRSYRAIGIAGVARAMPPSWMDAHLPGAFRALAEYKAPVMHYKICSTLELLADCRVDWPRDRHRRAHLRRDAGACELAAARRRRARDWTLPGVRQSLRGVRRRRLPSRSASGHATAPGYAHG